MDTDTEREPAQPQGGTDQLAASAQGWHRIQLAVLGFIGLCGVLQAGEEIEPRWLEQLAGGVAIIALVIACAAVYLVGRVAWPYGKPASPSLLRWGVALTYLATASIALAALSNWWPDDESGAAPGAGLVEVSSPGGQSWCGRLVDAPTGSLRIVTESDAVDLASGRISGVVSVDNC